MWDVNIALLPAFAMGVFNYGYKALNVVFASIIGAVLAEFLIQKFILKRPVTIIDGSAVLTGFLLALCCPCTLPVWVAFIGGFIAITFGKQIYGGLGQNIFNPAHVARAILLASWPVFMTTFIKPSFVFFGKQPLDAVTTATPLAVMKTAFGDASLLEKLQGSFTALTSGVMSDLGVTFKDLFFGVNYGGSIGEASKLLLLLGGIFLLIRGHITYHAPLTMCATVFVGALLVGHGSLEFALFHLLTGGLIIGALFMATDMVTAPITKKGRLIFGFGCGAITLLIRMRGGYPEGVCYAILIMNSLVPLIDKYFKPAKFGSNAANNEAKGA